MVYLVQTLKNKRVTKNFMVFSKIIYAALLQKFNKKWKLL